MRLETDRLLVRDLAAADLDAVHDLLDVDLRMDDCSRDDRARWLQWTILDYEQRRRLHQPPYGDYGAELKEAGELVGLVGLVPSLMPFGLLPGYADAGSDPVRSYTSPEIGLYWAVSSRHQRNGYATEAATALLTFGFEDLHLRRIVATTEYDNGASIAVMQRLGMDVQRNPQQEPFYLQAVGILDNPAPPHDWSA